MHKIKIRKIGNSLGAILPTDSLNAHSISEGDEVFITVEEDGIKITPYDPDSKDSIEASKKVIRKYRNALKELAR